MRWQYPEGVRGGGGVIKRERVYVVIQRIPMCGFLKLYLPPCL